MDGNDSTQLCRIPVARVFEIRNSGICTKWKFGLKYVSDTRKPRFTYNENSDEEDFELCASASLKRSIEIQPTNDDAIEGTPPNKRAKFMFQRCFNATFNPSKISGAERICAPDSDDDDGHWQQFLSDKREFYFNLYFGLVHTIVYIYVILSNCSMLFICIRKLNGLDVKMIHVGVFKYRQSVNKYFWR